MNKGTLTDALAGKFEGMTKKAAGEIIDFVLESIVESVKSGEDATFPGFGSFTSTKRQAREGRNPSTGATIKIAASVVPKFKAGKKFKDALQAPVKKAKPKAK